MKMTETTVTEINENNDKRNRKSNLLGNMAYTLVCLAFLTLVAWLVLPGKTMLYILVLAPILIVSLIIVAVIAFFTLTPKKETADTETDTGEREKVQEIFGGIIRNVPANFAWVTRNVWFSDPEDEKMKGYKAMKEGWRFFIPWLWHSSLGLIELNPQPRDPQSITVNTSDNQTAIIDFRLVTFVSDAKAFAIKVGDNRKSFEDQAASVVLNQIASEETQLELTEINQVIVNEQNELLYTIKKIKDDKEKNGNDQKKQKENQEEQINTLMQNQSNERISELEYIGRRAVELFNGRMEKLKLGIKAKSLDIQKILMPEEVRAAKEYETVTETREKVAKTKAKELDTIASTTGADPTKVVLADIIRDGVTNVVDLLANTFRTAQETKKRDKGEQK